MPKLIFLCQSGIWPILCQLMPILAKLLDMDFKFVFFPAFILTLIYKPILKSIRPKLAILSPKILQKVTKMAISQNPILPKCHSSKSPANFGFWTQFFFGGLNQKSALIIYILILNVSDKFIEKCRRSRLFGE